MRHAIYQYIKILISDNMISLNDHKVAKLPAKNWPHYPLPGITIYTQYNNEYFSLK